MFAKRLFSSVRTVSQLQEFNALKKDKTFFVDFYADWCGPCKVISPVFEQLASKYSSESVVFGKVNVDESMDITRQEGIKAMPTFKAFKDGQEEGSVLGADPAKLLDLVKQVAK